MTNTNLPLILHRFQAMADVKFSLASGGRFTLMPSLARWGDPLQISP